MNVASWGTSRPKPASNSCTISAVTVPQNDAEVRELEADPDWRRDRIRPLDSGSSAPGKLPANAEKRVSCRGSRQRLVRLIP